MLIRQHILYIAACRPRHTHDAHHRPLMPAADGASRHASDADAAAMPPAARYAAAIADA